MVAPQSIAKKSVSFKESVRVKKTIHINNYTADEIDACWTTRTESRLAQKELKSEIVRMECGLELISGCARGLEHRTRDGSKARRQRKNAVICAVLDEQELQRYEGGDQANAADLLASISCAASQQSVADSIVMGILDQQEACQMHSLEDVVAAKKMASRTSSILRSSRVVMRQMIGKAA